MRMYDVNRGIATLVGAGSAGGLVWVAGAYVGRSSAASFWASMGILAGAGLVLALLRMTGGLGRGVRPIVSPGVFVLAFLPVFVVVAWTLLATQPAGGWEHGTITSWSGSVGIMHLLRDLSVYDAVLAFGVGLVLGMSFGSVPVERGEVVVARADREPLVADEPMAAERTAVSDGEPEPASEPPRGVAEHAHTQVE